MMPARARVHHARRDTREGPMPDIELDLSAMALDDLVEPAQLQRIRDTFARSTGIQVIIGRPAIGDFLTEARAYHFCEQLRDKPAFLNNCFRNYADAMAELGGSDNVTVATCHQGMFTFGAWIKVDGHVLGTLGGCMVMPRENLISRERCEQVCRQFAYGGDLDRMFESLGEFPVYSRQELANALELFKEMANALSEIARRQIQLRLEEERQRRLSRYFSPEIFALIQQRPEELTFKGQATVLFTDLRGFTSTSENMAPEQVVAMLNAYFERMVAVIFDCGGTLDKFIGDAILAVFGAPVPSEDNARNALRAAVKMLEALRALNEERAGEGQPPLRMGVGVHTGQVVAGNIGSSQRMEYTVIGDTVNIASRLESLSKNYEEDIVVSEATLALAGEGFAVAGPDEVQLKGKSEATRIYRVRGLSAG